MADFTPVFFAVPERASLANAALRLPAEQFAVHARRDEGAGLLNLLGGAGDVQRRPPPPLEATIDEHMARLATAIDQDLQQAGQHRRHKAGADPGLSLAAFLPDDRVADVDEDALTANLSLARVPMYREIMALAQQLNLEARSRRLVDGTQVLRQAPPPVLPRVFFADFRLPALKGQPKCLRGKDCLFRVGDPHKGYVGRAFYLGNRPPPAGTPPLYCIDCLLVEIETHAQGNAREDVLPAFSRQPFSVVIDKDEYSRDDCIDIKLDERATGVTAWVPRYDAARREYLAIPPPELNRLRMLSPASKALARGFCRVECDTGLAKSHPLLATKTLCVSVPKDRFRALLLLRPPPVPVPAWVTYQQRLSRPMLLDRVIWLGAGEADRRRLPAVRLRRLLDATPDSDLELALRRDWPTLVAAGVATAADVRALVRPIFAPFEETVAALAHTVAPSHLDAVVAAVDAVYGINAALPLAQRFMPRDGGAGLVYKTALWRVVVAHWLTGATRPLLTQVPRALPASEYPIAYLGTLFADTHLDLRVAAARAERVDDAFFLAGEAPLLTHVYPLPHRVVCAEELPHFSGLVTMAELDYDIGWLKRLYNLHVLLAYLFIRKAANSICHVRSISQQLSGAAERHPAVAVILRLVLQVAFLGNMPHCEVRMPDATRLRIRMALDPPEAGGMSHTQLKAWMGAHRDVVLLLVRDHLVGIMAAKGGDPRFSTQTARMFAATPMERVAQGKWQGFARAITRTMGLTRLAFHRQTLADGFYSSLSWTRACTPDVAAAFTNGVSLALSMCVKTRKGRAEDIISKNMTTTEPTVLAHHVKRLPQWDRFAACLAAVDAPRAFALVAECCPTAAAGGGLVAELEALWRPHQGAADIVVRRAVLESLVMVALARESIIPGLEATLRTRRDLFHACAYAAVQDERRQTVLGVVPGKPVVLALRYLRLLLSSRAAHDMVRQWYYNYYVCDVADNGYKAAAQKLGTQSLIDFVTVRLYFRLVADTYRAQDRFIQVPADQWLRQENFARDRVQLVAPQASLPEIHEARFCVGCGRLASYVQATPRWIDHRVWDTKKGKKGAAAPPPIVVDTSAPVVRPMLMVGASGHCLGVDGERYCLHGKGERQVAQRARRARVEMTRAVGEIEDPGGLLLAGAGAADNEDDDDDDVDDGEDDDDPGDAASSSSDDEDNDLLTDLEQTTDEVDNDDGDRRRRMPRPQDLKLIRAACGALYAQAMAPVLEGSESCSETPLMNVALHGLWYAHKHALYGRCVWCNDLCEVTPNSVTTYGLSCMYHPHPGEFPDDHQHALLFDASFLRRDGSGGPHKKTRAAQRRRMAQTLVHERRTQHTRHPHLVEGPPVACAFCDATDATVLLRVFDDVCRVVEMPVCPLELRALQPLIGPRFHWGAAGVRAIPPLPLSAIMEHVKRRIVPPAPRRATPEVEAAWQVYRLATPSGAAATTPQAWITAILTHPHMSAYGAGSRQGMNDAIDVATIKLQTGRTPMTIHLQQALATLRGIWERLGKDAARHASGGEETEAGTTK